ncbi:MAG TPA: AAA family ATPase [Candidatus Nanopelagicales bacterium]|nr:AAA family ATPase [Candidatus Nanopelagicales bacterium]
MPFRPALGISDFRALREEGAGYIDKTRFIAQVLAEPTEVLLFPRPRRFGKTLNLSTMRYFLEKRPEDLSPLFEDLAIWRDPAARAHFQRYPVIFVSFKDVRSSTWESTFRFIQLVLQDLCRDHRDALASGLLPPDEQRDFDQILAGTATEEQCALSLRRLSALLHRVHGEKAVLLIDEYDTPIHAGFQHGFLDPVVQFFRGFFSAALKDNTALFRGVLTGILRVSRESLFSGLNNVIVHSILRPEPATSIGFATSFGFTEAEVRAITEADAHPGLLDELRAWYDGYLFGGETIYNPWSILNYIYHHRQLGSYWVNTSSNDLIYDLVVQRGLGLSGDMERLLTGGTIDTRIDESLVFRDLTQRSDSLWSFLLFTGYLKPVALRATDTGLEASLAVPNREVMHAFRDVFALWMERGLNDRERIDALLRSLLRGDAEELEARLEQLLLTAMSFHDAAGRDPEKLYHGFILGLLVQLEGRYEVRSNRESGFGRADVLVRPRQPGQPGVVLELKVPRHRGGETPEQALVAAAKQVRDRRYAEDLRAAGADPVHELVAVFDGKRAWVKTVDDALAEGPGSGPTSPGSGPISPA